MKACFCRLCYLCLHPPKDAATYESFGLDRITKEDAASKHDMDLYMNAHDNAVWHFTGITHTTT